MKSVLLATVFALACSTAALAGGNNHPGNNGGGNGGCGVGQQTNGCGSTSTGGTGGQGGQGGAGGQGGNAKQAQTQTQSVKNTVNSTNNNKNSNTNNNSIKNTSLSTSGALSSSASKASSNSSSNSNSSAVTGASTSSATTGPSSSTSGSSNGDQITNVDASNHYKRPPVSSAFAAEAHTADCGKSAGLGVQTIGLGTSLSLPIGRDKFCTASMFIAGSSNPTCWADIYMEANATGRRVKDIAAEYGNCRRGPVVITAPSTPPVVAVPVAPPASLPYPYGERG